MANSKATCGHQKEVDAIPATAFYQDVPSKDQSRLLWNLFSLPLSHNTSQLLSPTTKQYFPVSTDQQTLQRYPHAPLPYSPPQSANKVSEHQYALLPPVFTILSLAVSRTLAALPLPEGYYVTNYIPIPEDERDKLGLGNPQAPFSNATALSLIDLRGLLSTEIAIFKGSPESTTAMFANSASASLKQANVRRNIPECRRLITQSSIQCTENKARSKNHQADVLREAREAKALRS
jgi:hypothetical protein